MTRKCGKCGTPAPDGESKFCNRCGSAIVDGPEPQFPVCGTCGAEVADPQAQFCDRCGGPVRRPIACPACGNPAIDGNSRFCTRCGTTFVPPGTCPGCGFVNPDDQALFCNRCGAPLPGKGAVQQPQGAAAPSVIVTKKRATLPVQEPVADWDPWSDGGPEYDAGLPPEDRRDAPLPETAGEPPYRAPQVSVPLKKYAHLPLVADELKGSKTPGPGDLPASPRERKAQKKKGFLGFMKR
jgi:Double zinc ribbon